MFCVSLHYINQTTEPRIQRSQLQNIWNYVARNFNFLNDKTQPNITPKICSQLGNTTYESVLFYAIQT